MEVHRKAKKKFCVTTLRRNVHAYVARARDLLEKKIQDGRTSERSSKKQIWWITSSSETTGETSRVTIERG